MDLYFGDIHGSNEKPASVQGPNFLDIKPSKKLLGTRFFLRLRVEAEVKARIFGLGDTMSHNF